MAGEDGRRRAMPRPPEPPPGLMYFGLSGELFPIDLIELHARARMDYFDSLPRTVRDVENYGNELHGIRRGESARRGHSRRMRI
jgi:hypothetical protein